jgi:hypothetical protein
MNYQQATKFHRIATRLAKPGSTSDLNIHFMECMEEIEFAGNDANTREHYFSLFEEARKQWFPTQHPTDFFDEIYDLTEQWVA